MFVVFGMLVVLAVVLAVQVQFAYRKRKLLGQSWDTIVARLEAVNVAGLREIADLYLKPGKDQLRIEPVDMWLVVGGVTGLQRMRRNAETMLELAVYAERWNTWNGRVVSEMIRRDAMRLKKSTTKIELAMFSPFGMVHAAFSLQEAISSYCLMRDRLYGLYQVAHVGLIPRLEAVL